MGLATGTMTISPDRAALSASSSRRSGDAGPASAESRRHGGRPADRPWAVRRVCRSGAGSDDGCCQAGRPGRRVRLISCNSRLRSCLGGKLTCTPRACPLDCCHEHSEHRLQEFVDRLAPCCGGFRPACSRPGSQPTHANPATLPVCRFWPNILAAAANSWSRWVNFRHISAGCKIRIMSPPAEPELPRELRLCRAGRAGGLVATDSLRWEFCCSVQDPLSTHRHPAVEIYVVAAGEAEWRKGESPGGARRR